MRQTGYDAAFPQRAADILDGIENGVSVDFVGDRSLPRFGANLPVSDEDIPKISAIIAADVAAGKKAGPFDEPPFPNFVVSPIGCVPKKTPGEIRVIHHLSYPRHGASINSDIVDEYLELSRFADAAKAVVRLGCGCVLVKLDVEAAYKQVAVCRGDWPLLGFKWLGKYYFELTLPFGLRSSCRLWDWYAAALQFFFEALGIDVVIHYIDDFLFVVKSRDQAQQHLARALALCEELGIPMAAKKTEGPTTCLVFLGIEIDTLLMRARVPDEKLAELRRLTSVWRSKSSATVKELQSLAGVLNFAACVVRPGRFFIRSIFARAAAQAAKPHQQWTLNAEVRADVEWWHDFAGDWNGISLLYEQEWTDAPRIELFTDACQSGLGARFGTEWFEQRWTDEHRAAARRNLRDSMPFYELFALVAAASTWGARWAGKKIIFRCDCEPVVFAVNSGGSSDPGMAHLLRQLGLIACRGQFDFRCEHIAGVDNGVADVLSRDGDCAQFRALCPDAALRPTAIGPVPLPPLRA